MFSEPGFPAYPLFSILENRRLRGTKRGPGYWHRFPSPYPFPQGVMWRINMQMSVPRVTKCHRVQTQFVMGVTIIWAISCGLESSKLQLQLFQAANNWPLFPPALLLPPSYKEGRALATPLRNCLYSPSLYSPSLYSPSRRVAEKAHSRKLGFRQILFSETQGTRVHYFCFRAVATTMPT